jgi:hypothetical protein
MLYGTVRPAEGGAVPVYHYPNDPAIAFTAPAGQILAVQLRAWLGGSMLGALFGVGGILNFRARLKRGG